jgi:hypothetical protein
MDPSGAQLVHGLRLGRGVLVPGAATATNGTLDFETRLADPAGPAHADPPGEIVAALEWPAGSYAASLHGQSLTIRFAGSGEFEVDLARGEIVARPDPGREPMVPVFLAGHVLATVLGLRGAPVMHASAVELDGVAVAFAGGSGAGKSTAAALLCAAGGALVGDDTARIEERGGALLIHHGPSELRLRPHVAALAEGMGAATRATPDGRIAVSARPAAGVTTPLGAVAFPKWSDAAGAPAVARLRPRDAVQALLRCARVGGWRAEDPVRTHLRACARIASSVPAFEVGLSKASLLDDDVPAALRGALASVGAFGSADQGRP